MSEARRVLICDDEPQILRALKVVLGDAGYEVVPAMSAGEALDKASVRPPDAAIIDLVLPDGDGVEVCRRSWCSRRSVRRRRRCAPSSAAPTTT